MPEGLDALTDKEKETLRLMVRGHDAKSMARELSLSVHTINERLRASRRKLGVTSSREAARLLLENEQGVAEKFVDDALGDAPQASLIQSASITQPARSRALWIGGIAMFSIALVAALALDVSHSDRPVGDPATPIETAQVETFEASAREWLELVDAFDWEASFAAAGRTFRDPNNVTMWREASQDARVPLGAVLLRKAQTVEFEQSDPADPGSHHQAKVVFETDFETRDGVMETVALRQEEGRWKVVGYLID